jgi:hypothetical protein
MPSDKAIEREIAHRYVQLAGELREQLAAAIAVLAERERELLELKGPCSNAECRLHRAHAGPCA